MYHFVIYAQSSHQLRGKDSYETFQFHKMTEINHPNPFQHLQFLYINCFNLLDQICPNPYCCWKKSCTTWDVQNIGNNGINYLSTGPGFLNHQHYPLPETKKKHTDLPETPNPGDTSGSALAFNNSSVHTTSLLSQARCNGV